MREQTKIQRFDYGQEINRVLHMRNLLLPSSNIHFLNLR
jgi:hypothetical protein